MTAAFILTVFSRSRAVTVKTTPLQNIFVSYDMDHFEDEDGSPDGERSKIWKYVLVAAAVGDNGTPGLCSWQEPGLRRI